MVNCPVLQDIVLTFDNSVHKASNEVRKAFTGLKLITQSISIIPHENALTLRKNFMRSQPVPHSTCLS